MMRARIDRFTTTTSGLSVRVWLYSIIGVFSIICGAFGGVIGLMILAFGSGTLWDNRSGIFLSVFTGFFPLFLGAILIWRALVARGRRTRLRDLLALARTQPSFGASDVQRALDIGPMDAQRLVVDATSWGLIEESPEVATTVQAPPASFLSSDPQRWVGAVLGGTYAIERVIGAGGMGIVFAAHHVRTHRKYAVKTLLPDARTNEDALRRFEREATAASALGHPNIIAVHDYNTTDSGVHYIVLDLVDGESLEARLARVGKLAWPDAQKIALEIASALTAAHTGGLLHRDLKPQNIVLEKTGRAILLDFGLVKPMDESAVSRITTTGSVVGTPLYMSPEQARGDSIDVRSEVYALGAVVFEMVTGAPPFIDRTLASVYARLLTTPAPAPSSMASCPQALDGVLARALAKSPADRFPDVAAFAAALAAIEDHAAATERIPRIA